MNYLYLLIPVWVGGVLLTYDFLAYAYLKSKTGEAIIEYIPKPSRQGQFLIFLFPFLALVWPLTLVGMRIHRNNCRK